MTLRKLPRISFTYYDIALIILLPLVLLYIIELMHRGSNIDVFEWITSYTNEFIVNYLLYFSVINIFFIYYRRIYTIAFSIICSVLVITAFISQVKEKFRGEPLIPWDLKL